MRGFEIYVFVILFYCLGIFTGENVVFGLPLVPSQELSETLPQDIIHIIHVCLLSAVNSSNLFRTCFFS